MGHDQKFGILRKLLGDSPMVVEIGAHYGEDSIRFLKFFPKITLHCIEPDPRNAKVIRKYLTDPRMKVHEIAISNIDGQVNFYLSYNDKLTEKTLKKYAWISREDYVKLRLNSSGASSLKKGYCHLRETIKVQAAKLETWAKQNGINYIDFLWVDTQGAEREVIDGIGQMSRRIRFIWIEYGETEYNGALTRKETIQLLESKSFQIITKHSSTGPKGDLLFKCQSPLS